MQNTERLASILRTKIIPVIALNDVNDARPLAEALVDAGLNVLEVTFRTAAAVAVMREMAKVSGAIIGAGTVLEQAHMERARDAGCKFMVSPGSPLYLLNAAERYPELDLLPGIKTPTEAMTAAHDGHSLLKFFPAERSGGVKALEDFNGPLQTLKFCATGGITADNFISYLKLPNVPNVGGTWMMPKEAIRARDFDQINRLAKAAVAAANAPVT
jgi:2-dehydro-3-deoxyphosphogluconate aldolase / (4S)-4-hydroxy-2-oxoglutarate aldolase